MPRQTSPLTRRSFLRAGSVAAAGLGLSAAGCGSISSTASQERRDQPITPKVDGNLLYYNWEDMIDPVVSKGFEREYGVKVIQSTFSSLEEMMAKLKEGKRADVIFPSAMLAEKLIQKRQLRRIDNSGLRNADAVFDAYGYFANPWYDPGSRYTMPYTMYKTGIGWRKDKLGDKPAGSWDDLWSPAAAGKVSLLDDLDEVFGVAEFKLGLNLSTSDEADLDRVSKMLTSLRPHVRAFTNDYYKNLLRGDVVMAQAWSGDMAWLLSSAKNPEIFGFTLAKEGVPINSDCFAIPANAPHPGTATLFIDYMLRLDSVKKNVKYHGYPMPVYGSESAYGALVEPHPECIVSADDLGDYSYFRNNDAEGERARKAVWKRVRSA